MANAGLKLIGAKSLERKFRSLGDRVQRKVMRGAVNAAATPVLKAAKAKAPSESGALKKALGKKIRTDMKRQTVTAVIGAKRGVTTSFKGRERKPSRYSHLVEKGFVDEAGIHHAAKPFLRPAADEAHGAAMNVLQTKVAEGVAREALKGAGK